MLSTSDKLANIMQCFYSPLTSQDGGSAGGQVLVIDIEKEQIPDSSCSLIDLPLPAKRENAGALGHWPKKKIAYLFPYKFANFENQNLLA